MKTFYSGFMEKGKYKTMLEIEGKGIISGLTIRSEDENALPAKVRVHREGVLIVEIPINEASKDIDPIPFDYSTRIDVLSNMTGRDNLRMDIDYALKHRFQPTIVEPYPDEHWDDTEI